MNVARLLLVALIATGASAGALAQWKWRDRGGVVQYSDRPPPQGTPDKDVLERPQLPQRRAATQTSQTAAVPQASQAARTTDAPAAAASAPRGALDPELEARRRGLEAEKADKAARAEAARRAEEMRLAEARTDNCRRARSSLRSLEDGMRLVRTNAQGEREVLDDKTRAEEIARARAIVGSDCK